MTSIDILPEEDWNNLAEDILQSVRPLVEQELAAKAKPEQIEECIRCQIRRRIVAATDIRPVTFLHIYYI